MSRIPFHAIIFLGSVTTVLDEEIAATVMKESRDKMHADDLTGMAILSGTKVLRFIEGEKEKVLSNFEQAVNGPHFIDIKLIFNKATSRRYFKDYSIYNRIHQSLSDYNTLTMKRFLFQCIDVDSPEMEIVRTFLKEVM